MRNILILIFIIVSYFCVFVYAGFENPYKAAIPPLNEEVSQNKKPTLKENKKPKIKAKSHKNKKIKHKINFSYPKKFSYPSHFSKGEFTLYINNPFEYNSPSKSMRFEPCKIILEKIKNAESSVDFALYGISGQYDLINALNSKSEKGIAIKGVSDSDKLGNPTYSDLLNLNDEIKISYDNSKYIMHDKFIITDDNFLLTGSMNFSTTGCGGYNSNTVLTTTNKTIIEAYKNEFNQMSEGIFKGAKKDFSIKPFKAGNITTGVYFSPKGDIYNNLISNEIKSAKTEIKVSIFTITSKGLINDLTEAVKRGVKVFVIADAEGISKQKKNIGLLRDAGVLVKVENFGGKNHEKTILIDNMTLIMGSANFSYNGFLRNDENVIVIKDKDFADFYNKYFELLYNSLDDKTLEGFPNAESYDSENSCYDNIDNDFDGKIDFEDSGCKK